MRRHLDRRTFGGAFLFAVVAALLGVSTACNSAAAPSGSESKAANNVQPGGGSGGGGGGGTQTGTLRLVAWESGKVYPATGAPADQLSRPGEIWCWVTNNSSTMNGAAFALPTITLNGAAPTLVAAIPVKVAAAPSNSWLMIITATAGTVPANGNLVATATVNGTALTSNTVVTKNTAFAAGNTFAGGFVITAPVDLFATPPPAAPQPPATVFTFTHSTPTSVSSYQFLSLYLQFDANGAITTLDIENAVERTGVGTITAGSATGVTTAFANAPIASPVSFANDEVYAFQVIALDSTGWGVGSTVESPQLSNWVWYETQ